MKQTITITRDDGNGRSAGAGEIRQLASQGRNGDNQLAHVNNWEAALLKMLGGAGTRNPNTGLKEFYTGDNYTTGAWDSNVEYFGDPQSYANEIKKKLTSGESLTDPSSALGFYNANPSYFDTGSTTGAGATFNFPTDIMPTSTQSSSTYSGLPSSYQTQLLSTLMPQLSGALANMTGNIDDYTNQALSSYNTSMNNTLRTDIPAAIAKLANRGIINSTEGQKVLSDVYGKAATDASTKGYQTAMQAALLKANLPSILASLFELGKSSSSASSSYQEDPTEMYKIMANMLMGQYS